MSKKKATHTFDRKTATLVAAVLASIPPGMLAYKDIFTDENCLLGSEFDQLVAHLFTKTSIGPRKPDRKYPGINSNDPNKACSAIRGHVKQALEDNDTARLEELHRVRDDFDGELRPAVEEAYYLIGVAVALREVRRAHQLTNDGLMTVLPLAHWADRQVVQ